MTDGALSNVTNAKAARDAINRRNDIYGIWECGRGRQANYAMGVHLRAGDPAEALSLADVAREAYGSAV